VRVFYHRQVGRRGLLDLLRAKALRSANSMHSVALDGSPEENGKICVRVHGALTLQLANPKALLFFLAAAAVHRPSIPVVRKC